MYSFKKNHKFGAAAYGNLELLKWARINGCPWDADTYHYGQLNGDPSLMRYLEDHGCPRIPRPMPNIHIP